MAKKKTLQTEPLNVAGSIILTIGSLMMVFPFVWMILSAFKTVGDVYTYPPKWLPSEWKFTNFKAVFDMIPFWTYYANSLYTSIVQTFLQISISILAAYALTKLRFPGQNFIYTFLQSSMFVPTVVTIIPTFLIVSSLGLVDTYWAVILTAIGGTLGLYLMKNFIGQIPDSLLEAATIDGAQEFTIYWKIIMPLCKPAWITLVILSFQPMWGTTGGVFIYSEELKPVSYVLSQLVSGGIARTGVSSAVSLIMMLVPVAVFVISQSNVIETMSTSGMKD